LPTMPRFRLLTLPFWYASATEASASATKSIRQSDPSAVRVQSGKLTATLLAGKQTSATSLEGGGCVKTGESARFPG
jgi:hypothetical protein